MIFVLPASAIRERIHTLWNTLVDFDAAQVGDIRAYALRGIKWFHRRLRLNHGLLVADVPLTAVGRRVLQGLLTGLPENNIAVAQGQSYLPPTHEYVTNIYRKFGVSNRATLMALWLGHAP